jgi:hypothetical protein
MTLRDRKAMGGAVASAVPALANTAPSRSLPAADSAAQRARLWDDLFRAATPAQRVEMLSLAKRQGFLYSHQVPSTANGKKSHPPSCELPVPAGTTLLSTPRETLAGVTPQAITPCDSALDAHQREAVARALATPDVCLIAGRPGTGKSRVVAEILTQAAARGERTLLLAPRPAAVDHVLEQVAAREVVHAVRCLDAAETTETLPAFLHSLTWGARLRAVREVGDRAARACAHAEQQCLKRRQEQTVWPSLRQLGLQAEQMQLRRAQLEQCQSGLVQQISAEAAALQADPQAPPLVEPSLARPSKFAADLQAEERRHREALNEMADAVAKVEQVCKDNDDRRAALQKQIDALRPLARARDLGRWWTWAWWRGLFRGHVAQRLADCEAELQTAQAALDAALDEAGILNQKRQDLEEEHGAVKELLLKEEIARRQAELAQQEAALNQETLHLREQWQAGTGALDGDELRPQAMTVAAVEAAQARWQAGVEADEESCRFAQQWAAFCHDSAETLVSGLPDLVNLVAGTLPAFSCDKTFNSDHAGGFDLLVLEDADQVSEADFLKVARRARRWVLVGPHPCYFTGYAPPAGYFQKLWQHLACNPRQLPYSWLREADRLCCRLRPIGADQRKRLESERVADFQDVELRILTLPQVSPVLAEVVFPPSLSIVQAKDYIYRELQELPVHTLGRHACLIDQGKRWVFHLAEAGDCPVTTVDLESGSREVLMPAERSGGDGRASDHGLTCAVPHAPYTTCRLEFDKDAGWRRDTVEQWVHNHLGLRDLGRTALLDVNHRMNPELSAVLADLLLEEAGRQSPAPSSLDGSGVHGHARPLIFIPVPLLGKGSNGASVRPASLPKEGAGLETDLASARLGPRLPADLRAELPPRGIVNLAEAQAVIRQLEALAVAEGRARQSEQPKRTDEKPGQPHASQPTPVPSPVAVVALHAAQAALIQRLVRRSAPLAQSPLAVEVGLPHAFCHREFSRVLVSLTRSHAQRAVSFSDGPSAAFAAGWPLALTRARHQLILFGDPGTLVRRSQWQGTLDHVDEAASLREARWIGGLVRYLEGKGELPHAFHLCEGCT